MSEPTMSAQVEELAADLERFAAFIRTNPGIAEQFIQGTYLPALRYLIYLTPGDETKAEMARLIRIGLRGGAKVEKSTDDTFARAVLRFGPIAIDVYSDREAVCERVVTGTREVQVEERDEEAVKAALAQVPVVKRTEVVEDVEWRCVPIMAAAEKASE